MSATEDLVKEIRDNLSQKSASNKDEIRVMQSMLNDRDYKVGLYNSTGRIGEICPAETARQFIGNIIASSAGVSKEEAANLADKHEFTKSEAAQQVAISKEFINTYGQTTRKLPLGGRATSNVVLQGSHIEPSTTRYPKKVGIGADGKAIYESTVKSVPAHDKIKASAPCPTWVK